MAVNEYLTYGVNAGAPKVLKAGGVYGTFSVRTTVVGSLKNSNVSVPVASV